MTSPTKVHYAALYAASDATNKTAQAIQGELVELQGQIQKLGDWQGSDSESYHTLQQQWNTSADDLHKTLTLISTFLSTAAEHFQTTEQKNANTFKLS